MKGLTWAEDTCQKEDVRMELFGLVQPPGGSSSEKSFSPTTYSHLHQLTGEIECRKERKRQRERRKKERKKERTLTCDMIK